MYAQVSMRHDLHLRTQNEELEKNKIFCLLEKFTILVKSKIKLAVRFFFSCVCLYDEGHVILRNVNLSLDVAEYEFC